MLIDCYPIVEQVVNVQMNKPLSNQQLRTIVSRIKNNQEIADSLESKCKEMKYYHVKNSRDKELEHYRFVSEDCAEFIEINRRSVIAIKRNSSGTVSSDNDESYLNLEFLLDDSINKKISRIYSNRALEIPFDIKRIPKTNAESLIKNKYYIANLDKDGYENIFVGFFKVKKPEIDYLKFVDPKSVDYKGTLEYFQPLKKTSVKSRQKEDEHLILLANEIIESNFDILVELHSMKFPNQNFNRASTNSMMVNSVNSSGDSKINYVHNFANIINLYRILNNQKFDIHISLDKCLQQIKTDSRSKDNNKKSIKIRLEQSMLKLRLMVAKYTNFLSDEMKVHILEEFKYITNLEDWEENDKPVTQESIQTFFNLLLILKPKIPPNIGCDYVGNLIAYWRNDNQSVSFICLAKNKVQWHATNNKGKKHIRHRGSNVVSEFEKNNGKSIVEKECRIWEKT